MTIGQVIRYSRCIPDLLPLFNPLAAMGGPGAARPPAAGGSRKRTQTGEPGKPTITFNGAAIESGEQLLAAFLPFSKVVDNRKPN